MVEAQSRKTRQGDRVEDLEERARNRELSYYWWTTLELVPGGCDLPSSIGSDGSTGGQPGDRRKGWSQKSAKVYMMQTVLRTVHSMSPDERSQFLVSNKIEKALKDALVTVIDDCRRGCGDEKTG